MKAAWKYRTERVRRKRRTGNGEKVNRGKEKREKNRNENQRMANLLKKGVKELVRPKCRKKQTATEKYPPKIVEEKEKREEEYKNV